MADLGDALKSVLQVPGLQELLNNDITQQRQMAPVRSGVAQQAANMLPNSAFPGGRPDMSAIQPANFRTPAPSGGSDLAKTLALLGTGGGIGALLAKLLSNGGDKNGASGDIGKLLSSLFKRNGLNYPIKPGDGFGGDHTTTYSGNDVDNGFTGPIDAPYNGPDATYEPGGYNFSGPINDPFGLFGGYNGPDATYEPGGYNFSGPMQQPTDSGDTGRTGTDWTDE